MKIIDNVLAALNEAGLNAGKAYRGDQMPHVTGAYGAVSLEKLDHTARKATVLVTVIVPMEQGGSICQDQAILAGQTMEALGGVCVQEECRFQGYAQAYYIRVLGTFYAGAVMDEWNDTSDFTVVLGTQTISNAVSFQAEQALDEATGTPLSTAVWSFRLVEEYGRGEAPKPEPVEPFTMSVKRSTGTETFSECSWTSIQLENTATGLRQVRKGVAKSRSVIVLG